MAFAPAVRGTVPKLLQREYDRIRTGCRTPLQSQAWPQIRTHRDLPRLAILLPPQSSPPRLLNLLHHFACPMPRTHPFHRPRVERPAVQQGAVQPQRGANVGWKGDVEGAGKVQHPGGRIRAGGRGACVEHDLMANMEYNCTRRSNVASFRPEDETGAVKHAPILTKLLTCAAAAQKRPCYPPSPHYPLPATKPPTIDRPKPRGLTQTLPVRVRLPDAPRCRHTSSHGKFSTYLLVG